MDSTSIIQGFQGLLDSTEQHENLSGEIDSISYQNHENGWSVIKLKADSSPRLVTVTGHFASLRVGEHVRVQGKWVEHKRHGRQFKAEHAQFVRPSSTAGIRRYLSSGLVKGIGEKTARKIVDHFKERTFTILDNEPERLKDVPSIGRKKSAAIAKVWRENKAYRDIEIFLSGHGLSPLLTSKIIRKYGSNTLSLLQENPYRLANDIRGVGFRTADQIAQRMGIPADSQQRVEAATLFLLRLAEEQGHCFLTSQQLLTKMSTTLGLDANTITDRLATAITNLNQSGALVSESYPIGGTPETSAHYRLDLNLAERGLADRIRSLLSRPIRCDLERIDRWLETYSARSTAPLAEHQLQAVKQAVTNRVFVLTGGPGVGKTTTANAIIRLLQAMNRDVVLAAPTGRAAQRLSEVAALPAKTVHRLLEWTPQTNGFTRDELNPLTAQAIVIDEASMLDIRLAYALFQAITDEAQIILIGDVDQLPSVGPGNVLRDFINSQRVPFVKLDQIFRQAANSQIVQIAHSINHGELPQFSDEATADCRFLTIESPEDIRQTMIDLVCRILPEKAGYDPVRDIQVLTPMNRGDLGTQTLNQEMQKILNPPRQDLQELKRDHTLFRPGDKVIQSSNNYDLNVFNGDIGLVENAGVDGGKVIVSYGDRYVTYAKDDTYDLQLAYAITIHKSQGSEFPVVVMPISMQHYVMLQRNLIYTGLTRAKKLAILVGTEQALAHAIKQQKSLARQTQLVERIQ